MNRKIGLIFNEPYGVIFQKIVLFRIRDDYLEVPAKTYHLLVTVDNNYLGSAWSYTINLILFPHNKAKRLWTVEHWFSCLSSSWR
jgi:hypothetical protein